MKLDFRMIQEIFPFLIFVVIFLTATVGSYFSMKKQKVKMREVASRLGLQFSESNMLSFRDSNKTYTGYHRPRDAGFDIQQFIKQVSSVFSPWRVTGKYNGYEVIIRTERKDKKSFTIVELLFEKPLGMGLNIMVGNIFSKIGKNVFGKQSITTGNAELDQKVYISGNEEMKIKYMVKRPEFQQALLALYKKYPGAKIEDTGIIYREKKVIDDFMVYKTLLESLSQTAKSIVF
jgi:hypothetical protein